METLNVQEIILGYFPYLLNSRLSFDSCNFVWIFSAPIAQGYGLTETCAGGSFSEYDDTSVGRVGAPLPCSYIKVTREGASC